MIRILLTGSTGFLGSAVHHMLSKMDATVAAPTHQQLDLTKANSILHINGIEKFDVVLHFASRGVNAAADDTSLISEELTMVKCLLPLVREGGKFLYAGSVAEYGHAGILHEEDICTPQNAYARAKLEAGLWLRSMGPQRAIKVCVTRIFGAYGNGESARRLFPSVIYALRTGQTLKLSDGQQVRDFVHVYDVASACIALAHTPLIYDCVNIGTGVGISVKQAVQRVCDDIQGDFALMKFGERNRSPHDQEKLVADTSRLRECIKSIPKQHFIHKKSINSLIM